MRKLVIICLAYLFLFLLSFTGQAQTASVGNADAVGPYEGIIQDSLSQAELYKRCKQWVLATFKSADNNISLNDAGQDMLTTTPVVTLEQRSILMFYTANNRCTFKLTILVKPNRIKYSFANFTHQYMLVAGKKAQPAYDGPFIESKLYKSKREKIKAELDNLVNGYVASLTKALHTNGDW